MESELKMKMIESVTTYTEMLVLKLSERYEFSSAEALAYLRGAEQKAAATESENAGRGRPEKKSKKVVNKGEMVEDQIETILAAEGATTEPAKKKRAPAKKKAEAVAEAATEVVAAVATEVVAAVATEVVAAAAAEKPKKKVVAKKKVADAVVETAVEAVATPVETATAPEAPKKKVVAKKKVAEAPVEVAAETSTVPEAPKKKVVAKKKVAEAPVEVAVEAAVEAPKKKVAAKKKVADAPVEVAVEAAVEAPKKKVAAKKATEKVVEVLKEEVTSELEAEDLSEEEEINVVAFEFEGVKYNRGEDNTVYSVPENEEIGRWTGSAIEFAGEE